MATNIDIQQQLNDLLEQQNQILEQQSKLMKDQISLAKDLVDSLSKINYKGVTDDITAAQAAVNKAQQSTSQLGNTSQTVFQKVTESVAEASKELLGFNKETIETIEKIGKLSFIAGSAMSGFMAGLKFTGNLMRNVVSLGGGMIDFMGNLAASILAIPFKLLSGLISMSDTGGSNELAQALEDIRKEFGALHATAGKAIIDIARSMKGELANTGLSVYRVLGNLAERLKTIAEYAKQLGPLFENLAPNILKNAEAFAAYNKGLGLTEAGVKAVGTRAYATGQDITEVQRQIANYSLQLGKAFNLSSKMISRDMGEMMADFKHFGSLAPQELAQVSVYARKLGVDIKALTGVIDKFDNFEDAAQGAAHLSQAFGLNVDALELMKAQNPAERIEQIRKAFFNAGRSVESMTRQERALLAQQTGLGDDALDLVFSLKNQALSYADIQKKGDAAKKKQISQAEAMQRLADSIERLVKSGSSGAGGFFDRFIQGFVVGIRRSSEFRQLMINLQRSLMVVFRAGVQVGRMFVDMFPGVKDILKGLGDFFDPSRFRDLMKRVVSAFRDFFDAMTKNPRTALPELLDKLKDGFFSFFQNNSPNGRRIIDGFKNFFIALANIGASLLKLAIQGITKGIRLIVDLMQGKGHIPGGAGAVGQGALGFFQQILDPILDALKDAWPPLWNAIKDLFTEVWSKVKPWLIQNAPLLLATLFGPSVLGMVGRGLTASLITMFVGSIGRALTSGSFLSQGTSLVGKAFAKLTGAVSQTSRMPGAGGRQPDVGTGAVQAAGTAAEAVQKTNPSGGILRKLGLLTLIVLGMAALLAEIFVFALALKKYGLGIREIATAALAMVSVGAAMVMIGLTVRLLSAININPGMLGRIAVGMLVIGIVGAAMALAGYGLVKAFQNISLRDIAKTAIIMGAMGTFFMAAAAVTVIAGIVGAIALAGGGLGALAIAAGLAAIAITVGVMATQGMIIMRTIDRFNPAPGFEMKAKAFATIMTAVGNFAAVIARIVESTTPSFLSFITGRAATDQQNTLNTVNRLIEQMGSQLVTIVNTVTTNLNNLSGSEAQLKAGEMLGNVLQGVSGLAQALNPPAEALAEPGAFARIFGASGPERTIGLISDHVVSLGSMLNIFIRNISNIVRDLGTGPGINEQQKNAAVAITSMLAAVGDLAQALRPSPALVGEMNRGAQFHGVVQHLNTFIEQTLRTITQSDLFTKIGVLLNSVVDGVKGLDANQVKAVQAVAPIIGPVFTAVATIGSMISGLIGGRLGGDIGNFARGGARPADAGAIWNMTQLVNTFFERIKGDLPALVANMRESFRGMSKGEAETLAKGMEGIRAVFDVIGTLPEVFNRLTNIGTSVTHEGNTIRIVEDLGSYFEHINRVLGIGEDGSLLPHGIFLVVRDVLRAFTIMTKNLPAGFAASIGAVKTVFEVVASIPTILSNFARAAGATGMPSTDQIQGVLSAASTAVGALSDADMSLSLQYLNSIPRIPASTVKNLQNISTALESVANAYNGMDNVRAVTERLGTNLASVVSTRVGDLVNQVNAISTSLRSLNAVNINTQLSRLSADLGLGAAGSYRIDNRNFTIQVNLTVKFDNNGLDAFELALINRTGPNPTRLSTSRRTP